MATRLISALASEYEHPDLPTEIIPFEKASIAAVQQLRDALTSGEKVHSILWDQVGAAATSWLNQASS
jgi:hypothetical protein